MHAGAPVLVASRTRAAEAVHLGAEEEALTGGSRAVHARMPGIGQAPDEKTRG